MNTWRNPDAAKVRQALDWHLRLRDADVSEWEEFTRWLAQDPEHNAAYEAVTACDEALGMTLAEAHFANAAPSQPVPANDVAEPPLERSGSGWRWMALAASLAIGIFITAQMFLGGNDVYSIVTQPGETRNITLADGGSIDLNGSSEVRLDRDNPRFAELLAGEAQFSIVHDANNPFVVTVGESRLIDIGTIFNVVRDDGNLQVEVAEGAVRYEGQQTIDLAAGDILRRSADGNIQIAESPVDAIGSWVDGTLIYEAAPLEEIAAELSRATGATITLAPGIGQRRFSGVIQTDGPSEQVRERLETLLGIPIESDGTRWTIRP